MKKLISLDDHIFIAGGSGMVGSSLHRTLTNAGYGDKIKGGALLAPSRKELNLLNFNDVLNWYETFKPNVVIIAAGKVGGINANATFPADFILENLKIQTNLIELAWKTDVKRLLFLGSSCIYPKFSKQPIKEDYLLENSLEPTNEYYAISKIAGIKLCESLRRQYNFDAISLMPTNLYGPRDNYIKSESHVLPALIRKFEEAKRDNLKSVSCWGSGLPKREFLHVDDLSKACLYVLENWDPSSKNSPHNKNKEKLSFLNVGSGEEITIKGLAELISREIGFKGNINWDLTKPDGTPRKLLDTSKIRSIGWEPSINLVQGIRDTIKSFRSELKNKKIRI